MENHHSLRSLRMTVAKRIAENTVKMVEAIVQHRKRGTVIGFCLAFFFATVFGDSSPVKGESQQNRTPDPASLQSPASKHGLNFVVGAHGLDSLSFNGESLL